MLLQESFVQQMRSLLGDEAEAFFSSLDSPSPVSVRINQAKQCDLPAEVSGTVPWCPQGRYLAERPSFTFDPLFHAGCYYVQEASSMFLWQAVQDVVRQLGNKPLAVLDLCAAPGGKSTLLADALPAGSILVVNEVVRQRANILAENIVKWGKPNVIVTSADPSQLGKLKSVFDFILTDVPCSGEGMFRKEEDAVKGWGTGNVRMCAERQRTILEQIWPALKPGGFLVYSTCTYNRSEDEDNVEWICSSLGAESLPIAGAEVYGGIHPAVDWNGGHAYRFFPHRVMGEGLFMSLARKNGIGMGSVMADSRQQRKTKNNKVLPEGVQKAVRQLLTSENYVAIVQGGEWSALPEPLIPVYELMVKNKVYILSAGISLGEVKGKDFLPDTALALSTELDKHKVVSCELTLEQAIAYLSKEITVLSPDVAVGFVLVCYKGCPLGWVKNLGSRANNLYPSEWRIRTQKH